MVAYGYDLKRHHISTGVDEILSCFTGSYGFFQGGMAVQKGIEAAKEFAELNPHLCKGCTELYIEVYSFSTDASNKLEIRPNLEDREVYVYNLNDEPANTAHTLPSYYDYELHYGHVYRVDEHGDIKRFGR